VNIWNPEPSSTARELLLAYMLCDFYADREKEPSTTLCNITHEPFILNVAHSDRKLQ
jgi:hypothetical protein